MKSRPGTDANRFHDRHRLNHRDVERAYAASRKIHDVAGHRRGSLWQKHRDPVVFQLFQQIYDLPTVLDADQGRL